MPSKIPPGSLLNRLLAGKYRILREIGAGGMAAVFEARHEELGKRVAVKVLYEEMSASSALVERFMREARAAAAIESPFICQVHDVGRLPEGRPFLVMDFLQGESLYDRLQRVGRLEVADVARFMAQVARGLAKAHERNILHRDLKPENIFLACDEEGGENAKILDFGLARIYSPLGQSKETRLTRDGTIFGTPPFMSPEQVRGDSNVDHRADLWSLACVAFECLTGRGLWDTSRGVAMVLAQIAASPLPVPTAIRPELPAGVDAFFSRALARDPELRFQDAREFARGLASALDQDAPSSALFPVLSASSAARISERDAQSDTIPAPKPVPSVAVSLPLRRPSPPNGTLTSIERDSVRPLSRPSRLKAGAASLAALTLISTAAFVGYRVLRSRVAPPLDAFPSTVVVAAPQSSTTIAPPAGADSARPDLALAPESPDWVAALNQGQQAIAAGDAPAALRAFEHAVELNNGGATRMMRDNLHLAASSHGSCTLRGLGRPRPPDSRSHAHHGPALWHEGRWLATWTEDGHSSAAPGLLGARLDRSLWATAPSELTSQPTSASDDRLIALQQGAAVLISDAGTEPGAKLTRLDSEGRASSPSSVAEGRTSASNSSIAMSPQGDVWIAFADDPDRISSNIYARPLDNTLASTTGASQLTRFAGVHGPVGPRALAPVLAFASEHLVIAYKLERGRQNDIMFQTVLLSDPRLLSGVETGSKPRQDLAVGSLRRLTQTQLRVDAPEMGCGAGVCYVGWRGQPRGTNVLAVDAATGDVLWRAVTSPQGTQIAVGSDPAGHGVVAWYEGTRLRVASLSKEGMGAASVLARVSGDHARPSLAWGEGAWLLAWTSFEAGHTEVYAARVQCP
ncbi:MAG: serine/threonine protein kinase [Deltaproteobacteria bacterium]|nr:serine/threonine protein kinase [Deltaproteobacteria bacterium]